MKVEIDGDRMVKEVLENSYDDRKKTSLYLSEKLLTDFKKLCGKASTSQVMEKLMVAFIQSHKK